MRDTYRIGDTFTYRLATTEDMSASRYQQSSPPVFATPHLVGAVEAAAARLMEGWLDPGEMSVGGRVELKHTAPTPLGWEVRTVATLLEAEGKRFSFRVECFDELEKIGEAAHTRYVVRAESFLRALEEKLRRRAR
ncbi:MAG: thioesterase family protein [Deferrisomatales bacterium]|nr:thioesterase family protein [Deferrisomatales bacterium]